MWNCWAAYDQRGIRDKGMIRAIRCAELHRKIIDQPNITAEFNAVKYKGEDK